MKTDRREMIQNAISRSYSGLLSLLRMLCPVPQDPTGMVCQPHQKGATVMWKAALSSVLALLCFRNSSVPKHMPRITENLPWRRYSLRVTHDVAGRARNHMEEAVGGQSMHSISCILLQLYQEGMDRNSAVSGSQIQTFKTQFWLLL